MLMITRRRRAKKFLEVAADLHASIPELLAVYVIPNYDWRVLDFRYAILPVEGGRTRFEIGMDISRAMGKMYDWLHEREKKYPFLLDGMGADDRGWEGVDDLEYNGYTPVFTRDRS